MGISQDILELFREARLARSRKTTKTLHRLAGSRGAILDRLRGGPQTVDELARALGLTGNAVRLQLAALDGHGFVEAGPQRRTARRPSRTYRLAPAAESLFAQAYAPFLDQLLRALRAVLPGADVDRVLRTLGSRIAGGRAAGGLSARVEAAAGVLESLGATIEVTRPAPEAFTLRGAACPLGAITREHDDVCRAVEAMVGEMTGAGTRQVCERSGDVPRCVFEVSAAAG